VNEAAAVNDLTVFGGNEEEIECGVGLPEFDEAVEVFGEVAAVEEALDVTSEAVFAGGND
jgi:ethanolamine utilization microcompartment shell protein EutS